MRIVSSVAVVFVHATAIDERIFHDTQDLFSLSFFGASLNQLARFCTRVFVFLSGYGLTQSYFSYRSRSLAEFPYTKFIITRSRKILLPYLFLSIIFLFGYGRIPAPSFEEGIWITVKNLILGHSEYHLYFLVIILQLYAIYPLLLKAKSGLVLALIIPAQLAVLYPVTVFIKMVFPDVIFPSSTLFIYWTPYFYAGILFSLHADTIKDFIYKHQKIVYISIWITGILAISEYVYRSSILSSPDYYNHAHRVIIMLYTFSIFSAFIAAEPKLKSIPGLYTLNGSDRKSLTGAGEIISLLAGFTYPIYLYHTVILRIWSKTLLSHTPFLLALITVLTTLLFVFLLYRFLPQIRLIRTTLAIPTYRRKTLEQPQFAGPFVGGIEPGEEGTRPQQS